MLVLADGLLVGEALRCVRPKLSVLLQYLIWQSYSLLSVVRYPQLMIYPDGILNILLVLKYATFETHTY